MTPRRYVTAITLAGALAVGGAFAQTQGGGAGGGGAAGGGAGAPSTPTGPGSPGRGTTPTPTAPTTTPGQQTQPNMPTPIFVSGRVLLEDGTPPTEQVVIERVCNGTPHAEGYADSKGYFGFELGAKYNGAMRDASETSGLDIGADNGVGTNMPGSQIRSLSGTSPFNSQYRFANCELRARLAGYQSQTVNLATRRPLDNPDVGVILLHRMGPGEGGTTVSASSLAAPKDARKAYQKAMDALKKNKSEEAEKLLQKAVESYPAYAQAWFEIAKIQVDKGQADIGRKSLDEAIKADPKFVLPYLEIAVLEIRAQHWKETAEVTDKVIKLDSFNYPQAFFLNAVARYNMQDVQGAEKSALEAEKLDTRHLYPKSEHLLGLILAQRQDYSGAAEKFRTYLKFAPNASDAGTVRTQLDQIEKRLAAAK